MGSMSQSPSKRSERMDKRQTTHCLGMRILKHLSNGTMHRREPAMRARSPVNGHHHPADSCGPLKTSLDRGPGSSNRVSTSHHLASQQATLNG